MHRARNPAQNVEYFPFDKENCHHLMNNTSILQSMSKPVEFPQNGGKDVTLEEQQDDDDTGSQNVASTSLGGEVFEQVKMIGDFAMLKNMKIGAGRFGKVFLGKSLKYPGRKFAIKVVDTEHHYLEASILTEMKGRGAPQLHYACQFENENKAYFVMDLCGDSLDSICKKRQELKPDAPMFSINEVSVMGISCIRVLKTIHSLGYLHSDIKPANIVFNSEITHPLNDLSIPLADIKIIDYGLSRHWESDKSKEHIRYNQELARFSGTLRYAAFNTHCGRVMSRRDDLESLGYVLLHLLRGRLPWQGLEGSSEVKGDAIMRMKGSMSVEELCEDLTDGFKSFLHYIRNLKFSDTPDYDYLCSCLKAMICKDSSLISHSDQLSKSSRRKRIRSIESPDVTGLMCKKRRDLEVWKEKKKSWKWAISCFKKSNEAGNDSNQVVLSSQDDVQFVKDVSNLSVSHSISQVSYINSKWYALLTQRSETGTGQKIFVLSCDENLVSFCTSMMSQGYSVVSACASPESYCIVFQLNPTIFSQQVAYTGVLPKRWISKFWESGYLVTSIASDGINFFVTMAKSVDATLLKDIGKVVATVVSQKIEISYNYPSEVIHYWWSKRYYTTHICSSADLTIFVLSKLDSQTPLEQKILRSSCLEKTLDSEFLFEHEINCFAFVRVE